MCCRMSQKAQWNVPMFFLYTRTKPVDVHTPTPSGAPPLPTWHFFFKKRNVNEGKGIQIE